MKAKFKVTTPKGKSLYAHLVEPDVYETGGKKSESWKINVVIEDTPEWDTLLEKLLTFENSVRAVEALDPVDEPECIKTNKDGGRTLQFHTYSNQYLRVLSADLKPFTENPGNDSIVRVNGVPDCKTVNGKFKHRLWLDSVQVIEYVPYVPNSDFEVEDGNTVATPDESGFVDESSESGTSPVLEELT